jgi:hypothetical protein
MKPPAAGSEIISCERKKRYTAICDYQDDAIEQAREIARNYGSDVIIYREGGTIRHRISFE